VRHFLLGLRRNADIQQYSFHSQSVVAVPEIVATLRGLDNILRDFCSARPVTLPRLRRRRVFNAEATAFDAGWLALERWFSQSEASPNRTFLSLLRAPSCLINKIAFLVIACFGLEEGISESAGSTYLEGLVQQDSGVKTLEGSKYFCKLWRKHFLECVQHKLRLIFPRSKHCV